MYLFSEGSIPRVPSWDDLKCQLSLDGYVLSEVHGSVSRVRRPGVAQAGERAAARWDRMKPDEVRRSHSDQGQGSEKNSKDEAAETEVVQSQAALAEVEHAVSLTAA